ncbi:MAG: sigma-E processing peptidase SpoIIGA [Oscillospiraceae bacterium]|nr:sigma-E processing peptidase SpoIIGA [Oscillospiraceae bacterium]
MRVVYIDEIFALNAVMNYFLLLAAAGICGLPARRLRCCAGAAVGGAYAVLAALWATPLLASPMAKLLSGLAVAFIAFGRTRRFIRQALVFFGVSAAAAGAVMAAAMLGGGRGLGKINPLLFAAAIILCHVTLSVVFRRAARDGGRLMTLRLSVDTREVTLRAMADTGNSLSDPVTGARAAVISARDSLPLFPEATRDAVSAAVKAAVSQGSADALTALNGLGTGVVFRAIPYTAVGVANGILPAFRPTRARVDGRECRDIIVALSPNDVADNLTYSALL